MNYTEKYHLPQWEATDRIMRSDFNNAMAGIESGLVQREAKETQLSGQIAVVNQKAEAKPYVVGSYVGGGTVTEVNVGFRPSFVILSGQKEQKNPGNASTVAVMMAINGGDLIPHRMEFTDTGFRVFGNQENYGYPELNVNGYTYNYIAFR